ncbi:MAG: HigA family addiction module antitoxin [Candidatus Pseudobacter hemicellulosilyticus]|uniref:HigA family addiction module antitoxin n=1 Tax=Candidatus Pseudobacter hemicellulosilyticus TaxID=3121375 RepID=A0AAJ5WS50_9BACT|nr:MAG: HigA family addiction module antitoxin [Pseudobacter sp.]
MVKRGLPPSHPGTILREIFMQERNLTVTELAEGLGMTRANLSAILNMRAGISPEVAVKLSEAFGNTAQFWINLQTNYELWHAEKKVKRSAIRHFRLPADKKQATRA